MKFFSKMKLDWFYGLLIGIGFSILGQFFLNQRYLTLSIVSFLIAICLAFMSIRNTYSVKFHIPIRNLEFDLRKNSVFFVLSFLFAILSFVLFSRPVPQAYPWIFHFLSIIFLLVGSLGLTRNKYQPSSIFLYWQNSEIFILIFILFLAVFVRVIRLDQIPFGFWYDEAVNGLNSSSILQNPNYFPIFFGNTNLPAHFNYLVALSIKVFGESVFSVRFVSAMIGVLTVVVAYFTGSELFNRKIGLIFAFLLAVSRWDINWSRIGMHGVTVPFFELLTFGLLLRALRTKKIYFFTLTGLSLGLGFLFYFPLRFFPFVIVIFLGFLWFKNRFYIKSNLPGLIILLISTVLIVLPLIQFSIFHPNEFFSRIQNTSIFSNKTISEALPSIIETTREHLLMFNFHGDDNGRHNFSGIPMLDLLSGALFILGVAMSLRFIKTPKYFLLISWFFLMLLPGILSLDFESPQSYRSIGSMPAVYLLVIVPIYFLSEYINEKPGLEKKFYYKTFIITILFLIGVSNTATYFNNQLKSSSTWLEFSAKETIIGKKMASLGDNAVYYINALYFGSPTIEFLTPNLNDYHVLETYESLPLRLDNNREALIILDSSQKLLFEQAKNYYPNGDFSTIKGPNDEIILYEIYLKPNVISEMQGLTVSYFGTNDFKGQPVLIRTEKNLSREWKNNDPLVFPFGVEWKGLLFAPEYGEYRFFIKNSEKTNVTVDNKKMDSVADVNTITLAKGLHSIYVQTIANGGEFQFNWQPPNEEVQPLTSSYLFNSSIILNGLLGQYYNNSKWEGAPSYAQIDPYVNFYYHNQPMPRPYSIEWVGYINIPVSGEFSFRLESVDESILFIDEKLIVEGGPSSKNNQKNIYFDKGQYPIRVRFADYTGYTHIYLFWTIPGSEESIIPPSVLSPNYKN